FSECNRYTVEMPSRRVEWFVYRISTGKAVPRARYTGSYLKNAAGEQIREVENRVRMAAVEQAKKLNARLGQNDYAAKERVLDHDCYYYPTAHDIVADPRLSSMFDHSLLFKENGEMDFSGNFDLPEYVWHPNLGISDNARLVLSYYIAAGLINDRKGGDKPKG